MMAHTRTNLCSPSLRRWYTLLGNPHTSWIPPCSCMCVCCHRRRCFSRTRRHLSEKVCVNASVIVSACFQTTALFITYHHDGIKPMSLKLKRVRIISLDGTRPMHRFTHMTAHTHAQTFAALRSVVLIPSWAIAACRSPRRGDACAFC